MKMLLNSIEFCFCSYLLKLGSVFFWGTYFVSITDQQLHDTNTEIQGSLPFVIANTKPPNH